MSSASETNLKFFEIKQNLLQFVRSLQPSQAEEVNFDIKDLVCILQSLGYNILRIDVAEPEDVNLLKDNKKGIRLIASCCHSGQNIILEKPTEEKHCNCLKENNGNESLNGGSFWEVVATVPSKEGAVSSLVETGSDKIPQVKKEQKLLIKSAMKFLVSSVRNELPPVCPTVSITKPEKNKFGSMDTLVNRNVLSSQIDPEISSNGIGQKSMSSPNIKETKKPRRYSIASIPFNKPAGNPLLMLKKAQKILGDAIGLMDNSKATNKISSPNSSFDMLLDFKPPNVNKTPRPKISTPKSLPRPKRILSASSNSLNVGTNRNVGLADKIVNNGVPPAVKKPSKYSHVKSTIPKPSPLKKK